MKDRIVVDFNALDRIAKKLNRASSDLEAAMSILSGAYPTQASGAYLRLNGANVTLRSVEGTVSAANVAQAVQNYRGAIKRLENCSRSLSSAVKKTAASFRNTEAGTGRGLSAGEKTPSAGREAISSGTTDDRSWLAKFLNNELKVSDSVLYGEKSDEGTFWGLTTAGTVSGSLLYGEVGIKNKMSWKWKDEDGNWNFKSFGLSTEAKATGALAKGTAEGRIGYLHGQVEGSAITGAVSGEAKATLWDDEKFNPSLFIGAKAEASALQGKAEVGFGTDQYGLYAKADGDILHAEAEAKAGLGYIGKDKNGNAQYGVAAEVSAMASVAQGKVRGGFTIFGIDIDIGVKGYAVAAGVEAGASVTTNGVTANFSGALGLGAGLDISVDWSDAKWIGDVVDTVGGFVSGIADITSDGNFLFGWW